MQYFCSFFNLETGLIFMTLLLVMCKKFHKSNSLNPNWLEYKMFTFSIVPLILSTLKADHDFVCNAAKKISQTISTFSRVLLLLPSLKKITKNLQPSTKINNVVLSWQASFWHLVNYLLYFCGDHGIQRG